MIRTHISMWGLDGVPYSQSGKIRTPASSGETPDEHEARCWRERINHVDGMVVIPAMAVKKSIQEAAEKLGEKVKGRMGKRYATYFKGGLVPEGDFPLGIREEDVKGQTFFVDATGKKAGTRVFRTFPMIYGWKTRGSFLVVADEINRGVFERALRVAGLTIGLGRFRAGNGGLNGRFDWKVESWEEVD